MRKLSDCGHARFNSGLSASLTLHSKFMAHPDLDQLLNALLPFARQQLSKRGEFYPFGASLNSNGEIVAAGVDDGREYPDSQSIIDLLKEGFRQDAVTGSL